MGRPPTSFVARALTMPTTAGKGFAWASSVAQMDAADAGIKKGMFLLAWIEAQPALPKLRNASIALFYIVDRGACDVDGIDILGRPVAARAESLLTALENGPYSQERTSANCSLPRIHLCSSEDCVATDPGTTDFERIHVIAFQSLFIEQLTEAWYREGVNIVEKLADPDNLSGDRSYPPVLHLPQAAGVSVRPENRGPELAAGVGGTFSKDKWAGNNLQIPTASLESVGRSNERGTSSRADEEKAQREAAQIRADAFAAQEAKIQAEAQLREINRETERLREILREIVQKLANYVI